MKENEIKFEKALEKLEKIVEDLETGSVDLESALKKYEEGVQLSSICQKRLAQAEKKIDILNRTLDGALKKEPFDPEDEAAEAPRKKTKSKKTAKPAGDEDEDFLL